MTERHLHGDPPAHAEIAAARADIDGALTWSPSSLPARQAREPRGPGRLGDDGRRARSGAAGLPPEPRSTARASPSAGCTVADGPARRHPRRRAAMPVMHPGRVDVIGAGALVLRVSWTQFGLARWWSASTTSSTASPSSPGPASLSPVAPGTAWPGDPADRGVPGRPHARRSGACARPAPTSPRSTAWLGLPGLPRLVAWREEVASGQARVLPRTGTTGAVRCPAGERRGADRHRRSRARRRTAATAPAGCSPATAAGLALRRAAPGRAGQPADATCTPATGRS